MANTLAISKPITELFKQTVTSFADSTAISFQDEKYSFSQIDQYSDNIAAALYQQGIEKGDRVGLYCPNGVDFAIAYLGIVKAGAVVIPINLLLTPGEIKYILNDAGTKGLIYHDLFIEQTRKFKPEIVSLQTVIKMGENPEENELHWQTIKAQNNAAPHISFQPDDDLVCILYTSGTTGKPKGAMLTHTNLSSNTSASKEAMRIVPNEDILLVVLPMFHAFAATVGMLLPLLHGASFVPVTRFEPKLVADTIAAQGATIFLGVPSMYNVLLQNADYVAEKFTTIKHCISGGASMPQQLMKSFESRFGTFIYEGDGPTECSPVTCINPVGGVRKNASVGLPIPGVEMNIMDAKGNTLPSDTIGEICVRAASVMKGYWKNPQATAESFFGDWFRTGDLGSQDEDGYFYIVDRIKDMIIVNGMNVYPRIVEEVLYKHPSILEAAVIGEPDELHGENVIAHIVVSPQQELGTQEIRAFCREHLGRHQIPKKFIFQESLPKNAAGKILKRELRRQGELERGIDIVN